MRGVGLHSSQQSSRRRAFSGQQVLLTSFSVVSVLCKIFHKIEERLRLPDEEPHVCEECQRAHRGPVRFCRADDGTYWEASAKEWAWFRHDQIRLEILSAKRRGI